MSYLTAIRTRLGLRPTKLVSSLLDGEYPSGAAGRSLEFNDLREYVRGDDVKDIDWKASARSGELLVKRYVAQRRYTLLVVVPAGPELVAAATPEDRKADVALLMAGILGYLTSRRGNYFSVVMPGDLGPRVARPSSRDVELERMLADVDARCDRTLPGADLVELLDLATTAVRRRCIVVVILDDWQPDDQSRAALAKLSARHQTLAVCLNDIDATDPALRGKRVVDVDSDRRLAEFVTTDEQLARQVRADRERRRTARHAALREMGIIDVEVTGCDDVVPAVISLLEEMRHAAMG